LIDKTTRRILETTDVQRIQRGFRFRFTADFVPQQGGPIPDQDWPRGPHVLFAPGKVGSARWRAKVGRSAGQRRCQWFAFQTSQPTMVVDVTAERAGDKIAWCFVESADAWRYVRVIPRNEQDSIDFTLRVFCPEIKAEEVDFPDRPVTPIRFPF
jgi:hypothetical protein